MSLYGAFRVDMSSIDLIAALLMAAAASQALGPPLDTNGRAMIAVRPDWTTLPSGSAFKRVYPKEAGKQRISGKVTLECGVLIDGKLKSCTIVQETPAGRGFGEAAIKLVPMFQMKAQTSEGRSVEGGVVRIPLVFRAP